MRGYAPALAAAIGEELAFRGLFLHWALTTFPNPVSAVFLVNAAFGVVHLYQSLPSAMSAAFLGVIASVMTLESHSLLPALALHLAWNMTVVAGERRIARKQAAAPAPVQNDPPVGLDPVPAI